MVIYLIIGYCFGTAIGIYIGYTGFRSYWMTKGASRCYDMLNEKGLLSKKRYEPNRH